MASEYGYISIGDLEDFMAVTFDAISASYDDDVVNYNISMAERMVRALLREPPASATDSMVVATTIIAADLMQQLMFRQNYVSEKDVYKELRIQTIKDLLATDDDVGVDTIPMSGADRYYSYSGYY